ncbi:hypothetical protein [Lysobacter sp. CA199]|uniref:hypothetical protein n=1 Tax=Lysobacter sp. CA199 TaxID=3455608 RepID=UPI003F8D82D9
MFSLNGNQFDAKVQMFFNIGIFLAVVFAFMYSVGRLLPRRRAALFAAAALIAFCLPLGWENLIAGFQNQFYLLLAGSLAMIWIASAARPGPRMALVLLPIAILVNFTVASGALASFIVAAILSARALAPNRRRGLLLGLAAAHLAIFAVAMSAVPSLPHHIPLHARNAAELVQAFGLGVAWPFRPRALAILVVYLPAVLTLALLLRRLIRRQRLPHGSLYLLGISAWSLAQIAAVAYSRGHDLLGMPPRYADILVLGLLANIALALRLTRRDSTARPWRAASVFYTLGMAFGLLMLMPQYMEMMQERSDFGRRQTEYLRAYLDDGDQPRLAAAHQGPLGYPDARRLAALLDDPAIAAFMPGDIARPVALAWEPCGGFSTTGIPATAAAAPHRARWGSAGTAGGECLSRPFHLARPYALSYFTGVADPRKGLAYALLADGSKPRKLVPNARPVEQWRPAVGRAGEGTYRLKVSDSNPQAWMAFTAPIETGRLSAISYKASEYGWRIGSLLLLLGVALLSMAASSGPRRERADA